MARNPKDLVVSYYQFHRSLRTMSYRGTFQEFCRRFMNDKCKKLFSLHTLLHIYFHLCIPSASTEMNWIKVHLFCLYSEVVAADRAVWTWICPCRLWPCLVNNCFTIFDLIGSAMFLLARAELWSTLLKFTLQGTL